MSSQFDVTNWVHHLDESSNVCLSGGADGADLQWGAQAGRLGHFVIHWSFDGHKSQAPESELVRLSQEHLNLADSAVKRANKTIGRAWPSKRDFTNNLLRRNWYQVKDAHSIYAVTEIEWDGTLAGGTAWAVQMYLDRFLIDQEPMENCRAYVLDKKTMKWFQWRSNKWEILLSRPPKPSGIWAGVGSREISPLVRIEIRKLLGTFNPNEMPLENLHPIIDEPKVNDIIYVPDKIVPGRGVQNKAGGWATITRISTSVGKTWINIGEFSDNTSFDWDELKPFQREWQEKYGLNRASAKPDLRPESNLL